MRATRNGSPLPRARSGALPDGRGGGAGLDATAVPPSAPGLAMGEARAGWMLAVPQLLREFGHDPARMLGEAGVRAAVFDDELNSLSFRDAGVLLEHACRATSCPHFALLAGERFDPATFGETAKLMLESSSVEAALRRFVLVHHLNDAGAVPMLFPVTRGRAILAHSIYAPGVPALDKLADLALAIGMVLLRALCGTSWQPLRVCLPHRKPDDVAPYRRIFGQNVVFDSDLAAIVFAASWLDTPVADVDHRFWTRLQTMAARTHAGAELAELPVSHQVRRALRPMVFTGTATESAVARLFSMHPRTLRRHLRDDGTTFQDLANDTRMSIAQQLLLDTEMLVSEIAVALHYSDVTAFSRAFRSHAGVAPIAWRKRERALSPGASGP